MAIDLLSYANANLFSMVDLKSLPDPAIVDTVEYLTIKQEIVEKFIELEPGYQLLLESDPVAKVLEVWAYREMILRQRINSAARANLLAKAAGSDLDQLGAFYNVGRMLVAVGDATANPPIPDTYEDDESFRYRIQTRIMGWANAGGVDHYRYWALSAHPDVLDVAVYSPNHLNGYNMGGHVTVAVLGRSGNHVPTIDVLEAVRGSVTSPSVKMLTDIVSVESAIRTAITVSAKVVLLPRTPISVFQGLADRLQAAFDLKQRIGWDVTKSWITAILQVDGIHSVDLVEPNSNVTIHPNEFPDLENIDILFGGFSDTEQDNVSAMERQRLTRLMMETYIEFAVTRKRNAAQIAADLEYGERTGILQPTVIGLARYLGIDQFYKADRVTLLSELEIATMIFNILLPRYSA